ncbi:MAG: GGDEF domain-containing protein [Bacillota bacterium]
MLRPRGRPGHRAGSGAFWLAREDGHQRHRRDIDNFKEDNDTLGHMAGNGLLRELAELLKGAVREVDIVARYGGEEFTAILPETDGPAALTVAQRIRRRVEEHPFVGETRLDGRTGHGLHRGGRLPLGRWQPQRTHRAGR